MNRKFLLWTSEGEFVANPRFFRNGEKALAKAQRKAQRLKALKSLQGNASLRKAWRVVFRIHERIRNRRWDGTPFRLDQREAPAFTPGEPSHQDTPQH